MNASLVGATAALLLCLPRVAAADNPVRLAIDPAKSALSYKVVHPFHETEGKSSSMEGVAVLKPEGGALVQVKVDIRTFDSGNSNRDDHMKECTEANKLPYATVKGVLKDFKLPATYPADATATLEGELEFHGQKHPLTVPVQLHFDSAAHAHVKGAFDISLDAYQVERPSLMMRKIDDACHMGLDLDFVAK